MSLQRAIGGWCRGLERDWMNIRRELPVDVEKAGARPGHARHAIAGWPYGAPAPVLATPSTATRDLTPLAVLVDHAVRDEETDNVQRYERVTIVQLTPLDLGNALECVGIPLDPASWDTMRAWLPRMEVRRDDERAAYWWTAGFAALALGEPLRYWKAAGLHREAENPFTPGETFGFNLQGLLRHLGAAIDTRASFEDVRPAWDEFLRNFGALRSAQSVDEGTLLWVARIVFHHIAGRPLREVAQALHDYLWTLAGFTPGDLETPVANLLAIIEAEKQAR